LKNKIDNKNLVPAGDKKNQFEEFVVTLIWKPELFHLTCKSGNPKVLKHFHRSFRVNMPCHYPRISKDLSFEVV